MILNKVKAPTWLKRAKTLEELILSDELTATIIYLHTSLLLKASKKDYQSAFFKILEQATRSKTIVFIFQDNLDGIFSMRHWETRMPMTLKELENELHEAKENKLFRFEHLENAIDRLKEYESRKTEVEKFIASIYEFGVEVAPFYARDDVTIRLLEFLGDIEQKVFLRLFVPDDRLQADQLKSLLSVLERYLRQVENQNFSIDSTKSEKGIVYIFRSDNEGSSLQKLNDAFFRFDSFMTMCGDRPEQALEILKMQGINNIDSRFYIEKYSRDYRRIILDTKHEFERKSLLLKQRLESEIIDQGGQPALSWPKESVSNLVSAVATGQNVEINIRNLNIDNSSKLHTEIEKIINGSIIYNEQDKLLIELFSKYADGLETLQCRSDLDQLKDNTVAEPARRNAKQRLTGFLLKAAKKAGDMAEKIAVETLTRYLETLMKGGS